ncbi:HEAT repeat domain-containing protein [Kitasatospora sp. NPDC057512]|uniref:HEAT repeat domain-containing protein n=1 Tax=Kitasatospora sp. NPDC057512 TaxID=3346154 RepID=UPI00367A4A5D
MDQLIDDLLRELDADSSEVAEDAQHALIALGPRVVVPLINTVPLLGFFGQLCAVEVFNALADPRSVGVLIDLSGSESPTVRQWAAEALGDLGDRQAVPALRAGYEGWKVRNEDPDESEGQALRDALTQLGAREPVLPPRVVELQAGGDGSGRYWQSAHLAEVIRELAASHQAVLYVQLWRVRGDGGLYWAGSPEISWSVDRLRLWETTVEECRDWALLAVGDVRPTEDLVFMISWIDSSDL